MADIELVIKIPEEMYRYAKKYSVSSMLALREMGICINAVATGTPLPKGHGRLIDADTLMYRQTHHGNYYTPFELIDRNDLNNAPTIIEADKE